MTDRSFTSSLTHSLLTKGGLCQHQWIYPYSILLRHLELLFRRNRVIDFKRFINLDPVKDSVLFESATSKTSIK